jgi:hypothetical protein
VPLGWPQGEALRSHSARRLHQFRSRCCQGSSGSIRQAAIFGCHLLRPGSFADACILRLWRLSPPVSSDWSSSSMPQVSYSANSPSLIHASIGFWLILSSERRRRINCNHQLNQKCSGYSETWSSKFGFLIIHGNHDQSYAESSVHVNGRASREYSYAGITLYILTCHPSVLLHIILFQSL